MNTHAGYSKKTLTDTNVLLAGGGDKSLADFLGGIQYVSASNKIQYRAADTNTWTDLVTLANSGDFVTSLSINGNYLRWVKNGVDNDLTIPYATKAAQDSNGRSLVTYKEYSGTFPPNDGTLQWYTLISYTNNYYTQSAIIEINTRRATATILINFYNTNNPYITFLGYYGSPTAANGGFTGGVRVIADGNNAKIQFQFYASTSTTSSYRYLGVKVYSEIPEKWVFVDSLVADTATYDSFLANVKAVNKCFTGGGLMPTANNTYNIGSSSLVYKDVYATTFHGALDGNATTATSAINTYIEGASDDVDYPLLFTTATADGNSRIYADNQWRTAGITFNPSTNTLNVGGAIWRYGTNYGITSDGYFHAKAIYASRDGGETYGGISLYSDVSPNTYGIIFRTTDNRGKWGDVQSNWATYFTMNDAAQRGWIWQAGTAEANMSAALSVRGVFAARAVGNNAGYLAFPQNNSYSTSTDTITGALKIVLPRYKSNCMIMFDVNIFTYDETTSNMVTYRIGGFEYGDSGWYAPVSKVFSYGRGDKANLSVRFGYDGSNTCITIGETSTTWRYPQVSITNVTYGYSDVAISSWGYGWDISFVTTLPSSVSTTFADPYFNSMYWANVRVSPTSSTTTVPSFGAITMNGATSAGTNYITGAAGRIYFGGNFHIDSLGGYATYINHYTANNTYLVTGGGNVGIGTNSPLYRLHVIGDIYANGGWLRTSGDAGWYSETYGGGIYMTDSAWVRVYNDKRFYVNNSTGNAIHTAGGLYTYNGIFNGNEHIISPRGGSFTSGESSITGYLIIRFPIALKYCMMSLWIDIFSYSPDASCTIHCGAYTYDNSFGYAPFSRCIGRQLRTRFCYDANYYYIVIGESNSGWSYPKFMVRDMLVGHSQSVPQWIDQPIQCSISTSLPGTEYTNKNGYVISTDDSGNFTIPGNCYAVHFYESSDIRLKHDISSISQSIRKFRFNEDNKLYYGFIAQELETSHPELVDSSGEYKTVNYNSAICYYIAELENRVKMLEDEINKLKNK